MKAIKHISIMISKNDSTRSNIWITFDSSIIITFYSIDQEELPQDFFNDKGIGMVNGHFEMFHKSLNKLSLKRITHG
jgi:hypothetical protein